MTTLAARLPRARLAAAPPAAYFVGSAVFHYLGPAFAVLLFVRVEPLGVAWLRIASAAVIFAAWRRPWRGLAALDREGRRTLLAMGVVLALMNACFYVAIDHLPLGTVAAIEFLPGDRPRRARRAHAAQRARARLGDPGRLRPHRRPARGRAARDRVRLRQRRRSSPSTSCSRIASRAARRSAGSTASPPSMLIAAVAITPIGLASAAPALLDPVAIAAGIGVGIASSVIPYVCDQLAMARLARSDLLADGLAAARDCDDSRASSCSPRSRRLSRSSGSGWSSPPSASTASGARMKYARLGSTGLEVSRICLGMMSYGDPASRPWFLDEAGGRADRPAGGRVRRHLLRHRRHVLRGRQRGDHGRACCAKLFPRRDDYVLATKVYFPMGPGPNDRGLSRKHVLAADRRLAAAARHRLRRPLPDPSLGLRDADRGDDGGAARRRPSRQGALHRRLEHVRVAVRQGASTLPTRAAGRGSSRCRTTTTCVYREEEREMIPLCLDQGVGVIPWSPLARGLLAGGRDRRDDARRQRPVRRRPVRRGDFDVVDAVRAVADERDLPPAQIALAWLLAQSGRDGADRRSDQARPPGGRGRGRRRDAQRREVARLEAPYRPHPVRGHS